MISQFPPQPKAKRKRDEPQQEEDLRPFKATQHPAKMQKRYHLREVSGRARNTTRHEPGSLDRELTPRERSAVRDSRDSDTDSETEDQNSDAATNDTTMTDPEPVFLSETWFVQEVQSERGELRVFTVKIDDTGNVLDRLEISLSRST